MADIQTPQTTSTTSLAILTPSTTSKATSTPPSTNPNETKPFAFPPHYSFPPFFTLQPNPLTLSSQLQSWSSLILSYCRHNRLFTLSPVETFSSPLFTNKTLKRSLPIPSILTILHFMGSKEGGERIEWIGKPPAKEGAGSGGAGKCWVFWRRPEEWAELVLGWVEETGQKGVVLTVYEVGEGDGSRGWDFHGMDETLLVRSIRVLEKRGRASVFGEVEQLGVKFF
jgi:ESCRT-II complex subunit VPS25